METNEIKKEGRIKAGIIILFACIGISAIIVICNIIVVVAMESTLINLPYDMHFVDRAWLATVFWVPIGWIPNVVANVLLRKCGKKYLILKIVSWVLYFLVGPTGICNPIPMSV